LQNFITQFPDKAAHLLSTEALSFRGLLCYLTEKTENRKQHSLLLYFFGSGILVLVLTATENSRW